MRELQVTVSVSVYSVFQSSLAVMALVESFLLMWDWNNSGRSTDVCLARPLTRGGFAIAKVHYSWCLL